MSTLRNSLLPALDQLRGLPGQLGIRLYTVAVRVRTFSGDSAGHRTVISDVTTPITVAGGTQPPKIRQLTYRDVVASGGLYSDQDLEVGPITPEYAGVAEGNSPSNFDPAVGTTTKEIYFLVTGPGLPVGGTYYEKIGQKLDGPFRYVLTLRRSAVRL